MKNRPPGKGKKPVEKKSEIAHYNAVLLEEMRGEFKAVAEAVEFMCESLGEKIDSVRLDKHDEEIGLLKKAQNLG